MRSFLTAKSSWVATVAGAGLLIGLATRRADIVALVAPFAVALIAGVLVPPLPAIAAEIGVEPARCAQGERVAATVRLSATDAIEGVTARLLLPRELVAEGQGLGAMDLPAGASRSVTVPLVALRWGNVELGPIIVTQRSPGGFIEQRASIEARANVRVYPKVGSVRRGVRPPRTQVFSGEYVARQSGEGIEFATIQPYSPSFGTRRINWRVSSRRRDLHVNAFHPERNSDIVLFLDTFDDLGPYGHGNLDKTVTGAAALAFYYLNHRDRVGVVGFGGVLQWLSGSMGRRHFYRIVDYLLGMRATTSYAWKDLDTLPPRILPSGSLVFAFTPMVDERVLRVITDLAARGFPTVVIDTLPVDSIEPGRSPEQRLAHRVWHLHRDALAYELRSMGLPVIEWTGDEALQVVLAALVQSRRPIRVRSM